MFLLRLSVLALIFSTGLSAQAPAAPPPVPVTDVMALLTVKPETRADAMRVLPEEVRQTALLYLSGKIDQWYSRADGKGVIFFLRCQTVEEAKALMEGLPLHKAGYVEMEYIPVGPLAPLRLLTTQPASGNASGK